MPAVHKKLTNIFSSSPSGSPRLRPTTPNDNSVTPIPPIPPTSPSAPTQVTRGGMPSSCQLFDMFKFMAGGNSDNTGLAGGEPDSSDEEEAGSSDVSRTSTAADLTAPPHAKSTPEPDRAGLQKWIDETLKETERERSTLSARFTDTQVSGSAAIGVPDMSDEEKLAAIKEEFGDIAGLMEGDEPERMLADTKGSLFKGVMMIGNFHLTTHRLLFHAVIPPDSLDPSNGTSEQRGPDIIYAGPVTVHRPGLQQSKRVWMELTPEMVTTYPSANESDRVKPLRSVLSNLEQTGQKDGCSMSSRVLQGDITSEEQPVLQKVKTPPADLLRRSLSSPLAAEKRSSSPARKHFLGPTAQFQPEDGALPPDLEHRLEFNIGVFNEHIWFTKALQTAVAAAAQRRYKAGASLPPVVFQISGHDVVATDQDLEQWMDSTRTSSQSDDSLHVDEDESRGDTLLQEARKAERASMAAKVFGLKEEEGVWIKRCYVATAFVPARGHIILNPRYVCFWRRNTVGSDLKYRFRIEDVKGATAAPSIRVITHINALLVNAPRPAASLMSDQKPPAPQFDPSPIPRAESPISLDTVESSHPADILAPSKESMYHPKPLPDEAITYMPFLANKPISDQIRLTPRTFVCLTIGSRGDVQPYIALGLRLLKDGHKVVIVTHLSYADGQMFSPGFFKESLGGFREWLDNLLLESWQACHDADVLIESPSTMAGIHIAEALKIPYFRAFTMPWTRTSAYPHAFMVPAFEMGPSFNYSTYVLFDNIMWKATAGQINRWRKKYLDLKSTDMTTLSVTKVPFLYNFSSAVVPKPLDWHDDIVITGYWNLEDSDTDWSPSPELEEFVAKAKQDGKALGFGSIVVPRPNEMTRSIIKAVEKADVRAIIAKGWSSRGGDPAKEGEDISFPASCFGVDKIPHSWLFPKVQAALHHGGAGTVGASLRAGVPTLIKPWFGDQFFWSVRVTKLGVGLKVPSLRSDDVANALIKATTDTVMIEKAARIGEKIRSESGVDQALQAIHHNVIRAGMDRRNLKWSS
ncbi:hypothetical protein I302_107595 [Kwoniella bestiolae CBS 10118]|uniref:sterol 3beta-glucosyltransferase n=1 Tax=Kwoniella bestiolae CBS 10118 TaxID=1296100 RepID=A0AAJ8KE15_9TREE